MVYFVAFNQRVQECCGHKFPPHGMYKIQQTMGQHFDKLLIATTLDWFAGIFRTNAIPLWCPLFNYEDLFQGTEIWRFQSSCPCDFWRAQTKQLCCRERLVLQLLPSKPKKLVLKFWNVLCKTLFIVLVFQDGWEIPWISDGYTIRVLV